MFDTCSFKPTNDGFPPSSGGGGGAVTSVFGRTGVVIAVAGDYNSTQITNSSGVTGAFVTDALNTLDTGKLSTILTNGNIIVGNGSNVATAVAMSGDATIINTGALTISNQAVTFAKMQHISSQHLVGRHAAGTGDIQQISLGTGLSFSGSNLQVTGFLPTTLTSANIIVGNNLGIATAVAMSGDTTINNTGAVTISNDAVTTAKILNSNVTYAKIQNVAATRLLGNSTGSPAAPEEITLGTNLSFTGTTLNAAGGGGYTYLAITLSVDTSYNKAALAGANYLFISTSSGTQRRITIDSTGFVVNDFLVLSFNENSLGTINLTIGTTPRAINGNRGNTLLAVYDGTEWTLQALANSVNTSSAVYSNTILGFSSTVGGSILATVFGASASVSGSGGTAIGADANAGGSSVVVGGGNSNATGSASVSIGYTTQGSGSNSVRIGAGTQTGTNTGVVAIGQGITSTNTDNVVIGRAAATTSIQAVAIGTSASAGNQSVAIGYQAVVSGSGNSVAIGDRVVVNNASSIAIGASQTINSMDSIAIGHATTGIGATSVVIGSGVTSSGANVVSIGRGNNTGTNTGVVAIGQGITTTNVDAVVIGRLATAGGTANVTIGALSTGIGANCVRVGNGVTTGTNTGVVAIGQGITTTNTDAVVIGRAASGGGTGNVVIGGGSTSAGGNQSTIIGSSSTGAGAGGVCIVGNNITISNVADSSVTIGSRGTSTKAYQFAKGVYAYPRYYGAESRRIDTNTSTTDATNPSRHSENTAWIGSTNASTLEMLLFAQTGEYLTVQNNELLHFMVMVSAKLQGATDSRVMIMNGAAVATGGVASLIGSGTLATSDFNNSAGAAALTATLGVTSNRITMTVDSTNPASTGVWQWTANIINITRTRTA